MALGLYQIYAEVKLIYYLIKGKPLPNIIFTQCAIPVLIKVMCFESDSEVLTDSLWALSYLTDGDEELIDKIL